MQQIRAELTKYDMADIWNAGRMQPDRGLTTARLLLLSYFIWRVRPCGYDAFIYRLRTPGPVSLLRLFFPSAYKVVRSSSFVSWLSAFLAQMPLPDPSIVEKQR